MPELSACRRAAMLFGLLATLAAPAAASAGPSAQLCAAGARSAPHEAPASLSPAIRRAFGLASDFPVGAAYYRCSGGRTLACVVGANLPCFKANKARSLPGATQYCRENPGSDFIPMVATGHDTIYEWKCVGKTARAGKQVAPLDGEGYFEENWKKVE
ncbi:hypothetical protein IY145_11660 [Methylosinus sp. H3A]|uniref:hypothetical protein n=1 Tax=Methylosinus sp. H3A TaxID=2785786 RepID=UPI0018C31B07|nr:hypothetical protein [Methylosinus sp. H3A]MBG0810034.1 hypothetical protein [Methylosinus sp. H3A]